MVVTVKLDGAAGFASNWKIPGLIRFGLRIGPTTVGFVVGTGLGLEPEPEPEVGTVVGASATGGAGGAIPAKAAAFPCTVAYAPHNQQVPPVGVLMIQ